MVKQLPLTAEAGLEPGAERRVYRTEHAPLRLADGTPLYLEWIIEGDEGDLYRVPAEPNGWLKRTPFQGQPQKLTRVPTPKAAFVLWLTQSDENTPAGAGHATHGGHT
ncbi:MAG TPA: hypothetical protein VEW94_03020 [Chloroflexia bacterium]|nr:hypothetical protein [Chloroflexia bacterium]